MHSRTPMARPLPLSRQSLSSGRAAANGPPGKGVATMGERARAMILLTWAVFSAEQFAAGQAVHVVSDDVNGPSSYIVHVARDGGRAEVKVDRSNRRMYFVSSDHAAGGKPFRA